MKVNILGRGIIPTLKSVAPLMNVDLNKETVRFIMGSPNLAIYRVSDLKMITGANIDKLFDEDATPAVVEESAPVVEETPVVEEVVEEAAPIVEETVAEEIVEEAPVDVVDEVVEEVAEEAPVEETVEEDAPVVEDRPVSKKKNKKNRNNG